MIIAQLSDSHIALEAPQRGENLAACVRHIAALPERPDVVVHTGDIAHNGTLEEYQAAAEIMADLPAPLYVIPGNKDRRAAMAQVFAANMASPLGAAFLQYAVDDFPIRLVFLDSLTLSSNKGELCQHRLAHLDDMLTQERQKPTAVFVHHPPFDVPSAKDPFQFLTRENAAQFEAVLKRAPNATGLFCGHIHREYDGRFADIPARTMTAIALDLRFGDYPQAPGTPLYHLHRFNADGLVTSRSVPAATI